MVEKKHSYTNEINQFFDDQKNAKKHGMINRKNIVSSSLNFVPVNLRKIYADLYYKLFKFLNSGKNYTVKKVHGSNMLLSLADIGLSKDLIVYGTREMLSTERVKKILKKGDVVLDIGANMGYYCLLESKLVGKKGKVYAIEPVKSNIDVLKFNIFLNKYENIQIDHLAIGNENGHVDMFLTDKSNRHSIFKYEESTDKKERVPIMKLDTFVEKEGIKKIDFIRMDPEGYECEIIDGALNTLEKYKPKMFIETHSPLTKYMKDKSVKSMLKKLKKIGYKIDYLSIGNKKEKLTMNQIMNDMRFADETVDEKKYGRKATFRIFFK
jgi:FkbM family methyltransferase